MLMRNKRKNHAKNLTERDYMKDLESDRRKIVKCDIEMPV
jgi:hypothetical protein